MPSTGAVVNAVSSLQGQVARCRLDGTWAYCWSQLDTLSSLLTAEIGICHLNAASIDDTSTSALDAIDKCDIATKLLGAALSGAEQSAAISAAHVAMLAVAGLLPSSTYPMLFG